MTPPNVQQSLVVLKPDTVQRRLVGRIIDRFERKGLKITALKFVQLSQDRAERMYAVHEGSEFYERLMRFVLSGPVVAMVLAGPDAVEVVRAMMGPTNSRQAQPGTIRGDFGMDQPMNLVHGSDSADSVANEIAVFFELGEIVEYTLDTDAWTHGG